jgi:hypothetical protein
LGIFKIHIEFGEPISELRLEKKGILLFYLEKSKKGLEE